MISLYNSLARKSPFACIVNFGYVGRVCTYGDFFRALLLLQYSLI